MPPALIVVLSVLILWLLLREAATLLLYSIALNAVTTGRKESARRLMERLIVRRTWLADALRSDVRFRLSWLHMERGEYPAAVELLQQALKERRCKPAVEANFRQRLAEALEGAGQTDTAEAERRSVLMLLEGAAINAERLLSEAEMLNRQQRFADAYTVLERALPMIPSWDKENQAKTRVQLALAAFNKGENDEIIRWGEEALTFPSSRPIQTLAHSIAGLGYASQGRLEEAELHRRRALDMATEIGNHDQIAKYKAQVAEILRRRGNLTEAMQLCEETRPLSVAERRSVYSVEYECLKDWGRFEEALDTLNALRRSQSFPTPSAARRMAAVYDAAQAVLYLELGRPSEALPLLDGAIVALTNDSKLNLIYRGNRVWARAASGRQEETQTEAQRIAEQLPEFASSRGTQLDILYSLGRAYLVQENYTYSLACWEQYLEQKPDPVNRPTGLYYAALCHLKQGRTDSALSLLHQVIESGLDRYSVRLAQKQLEALRATPPRT
jgi:tetratricopeptide (TPR) repeat protein